MSAPSRIIERGFWRSRRGALLIAVAALGAVGVAAWVFFRPLDQRDILEIAYAIPDGGGYCPLTETGVPEPVLHQGIEILRASKGGTYCSGFTFHVAMKALAKRGLLVEKAPYEIKRFQREWYGATKASETRQAALAMENLGVGREIPPWRAEPGDFLTYIRGVNSGHSAIFLEWVRADDVIVGFRYRSSQPWTNGVADVTEYFTTSGYRDATVDPKRFIVARLSR